MQKLTLFLCTLFLMLASTTTLARTDLTRSPFKDVISTAVNEAEDDIDDLEATSSAASYLSDGLLNYRVARVTYDVASDGGGIGAYPLGVTLPANALLRQSYFYLKTQFVSASSGTLALSCEDANNIYSASTAVLTPTPGGALAGAQTGAASAMTGGISSACEVTATIASASFTGGKLNLFIEYLVRD